MKTNLPALSFLCLLSLTTQAQPNVTRTPPVQWYHLGPATDKAIGIRTEWAYELPENTTEFSIPRLLTLLMPLPATAQPSRVKTDSIVLGNAVLYYHTYGTGTPIVILSGGPGISAGQESDVAEALSRNYQTVLFEQRGTGRSWTKPMDSTTINLPTALTDLERLRNRLGLAKLNIYGHSWGAMLGAAYAAQYPNRVSLLMLSGSGEINLDHSPIVNASVDQRWQFSDTTAYFYWADSVNSKRDPQKAQYELRKLGMYTKIYDRRQIDRIFPQILKGDRNPTMSLLMWASLRREKFNLVQAEVQDINECGHFASVEQPEKFFGIVNDFLRRHLTKAKKH